MALHPDNSQHAKQISAGTVGRQKGHSFEHKLAEELNTINLNRWKEYRIKQSGAHLFDEKPALSLIRYIEQVENTHIEKIRAWWVGGLATSSKGDVLIDENGAIVKKCKSDVVVDIWTREGVKRIGISVKSCSTARPTNAQMYFTTASAFCDLLEAHNITVPNEARIAMCQFCGDLNYRPIDLLTKQELQHRSPNGERYFWEELSPIAQKQWEELFAIHQDDVTRLLFQKAYKDDPYPPSYLIHATHKVSDFDRQECAIFTIDEIIEKSSSFSRFKLSDYKIRKGSYKDDKYVHKAPSFGFIQFQRGGQKQHPTQLQFNLKAGYFYHLNN